ncbi:MAG: sporulation protein YabP [Paenibacillaceae bacterium]|nr:sporulation protein YabP [Paenibacillaceae bacterium]
MEEKISVRPHRLTIDNRASSTMTGIRDVVSFDENQVVLDTDMGLLTLKGKDLHVSRLTLEKGEVDLNGTIESLLYSSNEALRRSGESILSRLFK